MQSHLQNSPGSDGDTPNFAVVMQSANLNPKYLMDARKNELQSCSQTLKILLALIGSCQIWLQSRSQPILIQKIFIHARKYQLQSSSQIFKIPWILIGTLQIWLKSRSQPFGKHQRQSSSQIFKIHLVLMGTLKIWLQSCSQPILIQNI